MTSAAREANFEGERGELGTENARALRLAAGICQLFVLVNQQRALKCPKKFFSMLQPFPCLPALANSQTRMNIPPKDSFNQGFLGPPPHAALAVSIKLGILRARRAEFATETGQDLRAWAAEACPTCEGVRVVPKDQIAKAQPWRTTRGGQKTIEGDKSKPVALRCQQGFLTSHLTCLLQL